MVCQGCCGNLSHTLLMWLRELPARAPIEVRSEWQHFLLRELVSHNVPENMQAVLVADVSPRGQRPSREPLGRCVHTTSLCVFSSFWPKCGQCGVMLEGDPRNEGCLDSNCAATGHWHLEGVTLTSGSSAWSRLLIPSVLCTRENKVKTFGRQGFLGFHAQPIGPDLNGDLS